MIPLTALVLTFNEEDNVTRTFGALRWAEQVVMVDSFSTDKTVQLARAAHPSVEIIQRKFDSHTAQWNFGLDQVRTPWVLSLDADYELSPELINEIRKLDPHDEVGGYSATFRYRIFGKTLRTSVYPPRTVLFRRDRGRYRDDGHTQLLELDGLVLPLVGKIYHDDRKPLKRWLASQDRYMLIEAQHLLNTPTHQLSRQDRLRRQIFFAPAVMFLYLLFARGLILDGWPGWFYVFQRTLAEMLLALRLLIERERMEG